MSTEQAPEPSPAETLIASLAKRGVTLHSDGTRLWPTPKASLNGKDAAAVDALHAELVALLSPPKTKTPAAE